MAAGKHTLRSGKLHLPREKGDRFRKIIRPGDRFDATKSQLAAFGDIIVTHAVYLSMTSDKVEEVEGDDAPAPTDKPKAKRKSRAKTAKKPESEPEAAPEPEPIK